MTLRIGIATLTVVLAMTQASHASDVDELVRMIEVAGSGGTMQFLRELQSLGDIDFSKKEIASAVRSTRVKGPLKQLLASTNRLRVRDDRVRIDMKKPVSPPIKGGVLRLGKVATFRIRKGRDTTRLDKIRGIQVGESRDALYDLKKVDFKSKGSRPVAEVTAGVAFFTRTVTIPLSPPSPSASAPPPTALAEAPPIPRPNPRRGLIDVFEGAGN